METVETSKDAVHGSSECCACFFLKLNCFVTTRVNVLERSATCIDLRREVEGRLGSFSGVLGGPLLSEVRRGIMLYKSLTTEGNVAVGVLS